MKKVLIVTNVFPPQFAPRMGYLTKYLEDFHWEAFVLSAAFDTLRCDKDFSFLTDYAEVARVYVSNNEQQEYLRSQKYSFPKKLKSFFLPDHNRPPAVNEKMLAVGTNILQKYKFDLILCSTPDVTPLGVAKKLSDRFCLPWVADLRDIYEQTGKHKRPLRERMVLPRIKLRRNYLLRKAAAVASVSPWHVDWLRTINPDCYLIYNGFDPELFRFEKPRPAPKFTLCYPGHITPHQNLSLLFSAVARLKGGDEINPKQFQIKFFSDTKTQQIVKAAAQYFNIEDLIDYNEFVSGHKVPDILHSSSVLILLSDKSAENGPKGIMTTKFFEYLGTGRPILLTRSDEGVLEKALLGANAGWAARSIDDAYHFIKGKYSEWQKKGYTTGSTDPEVIKQYSRKEQARQFVSLFETVLSKQEVKNRIRT